MTVLFCDLVGSTRLADTLDPEDLLDALSAYHALVKRIAARLGGFVARVTGDGVDVYFGYPTAGRTTPCGRSTRAWRLSRSWNS